MAPQVLVRYLENQIPRKVYSMTPQVLVGQIPRKVYSMTPQVLVRYLEKYIQ